MTTVYEYPEWRRNVLTASGEIMLRSDAEALDYTIAPYTDLVARSQRIATQHPEYSDLVTLPPFGLTVSPNAAKAMGFAISQAKKPRATTPRLNPESAWRSSIFALTEAQERPAATAELLTSRSPLNLTPEQARAFLRGLPVETDHTDTTEETTMTTDTDPRAARLAEIDRSMSAFNKSRGHAGKAIRTDAKDIDPVRLKRLAEIRYSTMYTSGRGHTQEARTLKHALDTHDTTGAPLSRVFAQLGFDASKLVSTNI